MNMTHTKVSRETLDKITKLQKDCKAATRLSVTKSDVVALLASLAEVTPDWWKIAIDDHKSDDVIHQN